MLDTRVDLNDPTWHWWPSALHAERDRSFHWRWRNFAPHELASSRGQGELLIHGPSLDLLQRLRELMDTALVVNSAYRSPSYNARVGGAPLSQHKIARAFDLSVVGRPFERHELLKKARAVGFTGFGFYVTFLHVDTGPPRSWNGSKRGGEAWSS